MEGAKYTYSHFFRGMGHKTYVLKFLVNNYTRELELGTLTQHWTMITPQFNCRILLYYRNMNVYKKVDLIILKNDGVTTILS